MLMPRSSNLEATFPSRNTGQPFVERLRLLTLVISSRPRSATPALLCSPSSRTCVDSVSPVHREEDTDKTHIRTTLATSQGVPSRRTGIPAAIDRPGSVRDSASKSVFESHVLEFRPRQLKQSISARASDDSQPTVLRAQGSCLFLQSWRAQPAESSSAFGKSQPFFP